MITWCLRSFKSHYGAFFPCSLMDTQVACSPVGPMRRMMRKQMLYMQHWTRGWMKDAKKEGYYKICSFSHLRFRQQAYASQVLHSIFNVWHPVCIMLHVSVTLTAVLFIFRELREKEEIEKYRMERPKIQQQFSDLKVQNCIPLHAKLLPFFLPVITLDPLLSSSYTCL